LLFLYSCRQREVLLRREYAAAVALLNSALPPLQQIVYVPWDFNKHAKQPGANILLELAPVLSLSLEASGGGLRPAGQQRLTPPHGKHQAASFRHV
jgi:hypothetical protein